ncbi:MAG: multi-sensor signal transduction histidine kinase, partial [Conexibacter sp.]|nr:multi-sensor signal transduction histidine kinase [Conexibacter sp.]
ARADTFTEEDDRVLTELARQAGLAFHNSQLDSALHTTQDALRKQADELRESRARVVASGDAERRRVERNLHDGAQQHLVALAINLRLTRDIVAEDPEGAGEMLGQLAEDVQTTIKELRELAHGIYPPLLADNGLGDALRAAAAEVEEEHGVPVEVVTVGDHDLDEPHRALVAAAREALTNAVRHSGSDEPIALYVEVAGGRTEVFVRDRGRGFDPGQVPADRRGVRESIVGRMARHGGRAAVHSTPGQGTEVELVLDD